MTRLPWFMILVAGLSFDFSFAAQAADTVLESGPSKVHLLELFTSEGCSSCPPAEAWLAKLKENRGLWSEFVPVAFHVDYWDHLGWRDPFASREWTARQQSYAARWHSDDVYTPAFVLDGNEWRNQELPRRAVELIGSLRLDAGPDNVLVTFKSARNDARAYDVYLARLGSGLSSDVNAGENRGRKLRHDFVVLSLQKAAIAANATQVNLSLDKSHPNKNGALAAWVTYAGDPTPLQAVGGWLP